jgi:hypothetical protein
VSSALVATSSPSPASAKSPAAAASPLSRSQSLIGNLKPTTPVRDSFSAAGGGAASALVSPKRRGGDPLLPPMPQSTPPHAAASSSSSRNLVRPTTSAAAPSRGLGNGSSSLGTSLDLGSASFAENDPLAQDLAQDEAAESALPSNEASSPDWRTGSISDGVTGAVTSPPPRGKASHSVSPLSPLSIDPQLAARRASMGFNPLSPLVSPPPGHERRLPAHVTGAVESPTAWRIKLRAPPPPADGAVKLTPGEAFKARKKAELMNGSKLAQEARRQSLAAIEAKERAERARPADQVRLHVRTMDERHFVLDCKADDTVLTVKRRLAAKDAVRFVVAHQRLRCRALAAVRADSSDELDDDSATLGACGVQNDAIVHLLLEPGFGVTVRTLIMSSEFPLHVYRDWTVCRLRRALEAAHGRARKGGSEGAAAVATGTATKARPGMAARGSLSSSQPAAKSTTALAALTGGIDAGMPGTFPFDPVAACRLTYRGATLRHDDARTLEAIGLFEGSVIFALLNDRLPPVDAIACDACGERWAPATVPQAGAASPSAGAAGAAAAAVASPSPLSPSSMALPASNELPASLSRW